MNKLDIVIAIILLIGIYKGYRNGFLMGLISLLAIVLGIFGGFKLMGEGMLFLQKEFNADTSVLPYLSFLLIFIIIVVLVNLFGKLIKTSIDKTMFGVVDEILGAALGGIKWLFLLSVLFWIVDSMDFEPWPEWTEGSILYPFTITFATELSGYVSDILPFFKETFKQF